MSASPPVFDLAEQLGVLLLARHACVTTAESCTGGAIAAAITEVPGSSQWFDRGFVTYSSAAKHELLGVNEELLAATGAVNEPVVRAMAEGARRRAAADFSIAVTGLAGPTGDGSNTPVGTVWLAWASAAGTRSQCVHLSGERAQVRAACVVLALQGLLVQLQKNTV